jgi:putative oxidoreductase
MPNTASFDTRHMDAGAPGSNARKEAGRTALAAPTTLWQDIALLLARLFMAALFLPSGISKLMNFSGFAQAVGGMRFFNTPIPYPEVMAAIGVAIEIIAPLMIVIGIATRPAAILLVAFVIASTGMAHRYWEFEAPQRQPQQINFYKNVAIAGGLLALFAAGPGAISMDGKRRRRDF